MATDDLSPKFKGLKINESQDINILLLGETGVGKSTFINSIANYLHFRTFKQAVKAEDLLILIPSVITVTDESTFEQVTLTVGSDNNEYQEIGAAGTQDVKTYVFPIGEGKTRLRLIDSPGMGDPRGIGQDDINCENILAYLAQLKELHAICFLMKPTTTRRTVFFEYCVKQILSRLEKSASKNIIFIFTNTRGTDYTPGDTLPCLKTVIDEIKGKPPHVEIPLKGNTFSVDNEAFRILVAMKKGMNFREDVQAKFVQSWTNSAKECWRLILYILGDMSHDGLKPHQLVNTLSINEARRIIVQLSQPLADITQLIHDNIRILERHKTNLKMDNQSLDQLKKKLYIPVINLEVTQLTQPVTICTSAKCADMVQVGEVQKWHYRQRCHDPCYLTNVTKEIIGDLNLQSCAAMSGRMCQKCTCDFSVHMHVYYLTKTVSDKLEDQVIKDNINRKEEALRESQRLIGQIDQRKIELEKERNVIISSTAQFAHFLQHNAISPFNDSYKAYIEYLILREESLGRTGDREVIYSLQQLLGQYEEIKAAFENSLRLNQQVGLDAVVPSTITAQSVLQTIHQLYQLKHNGKKIRELIKKQKSSRDSEYAKNCEYIHPKSSDISQTEGKKDKKKDKKKDGRSTDDDRKKDKSKTDDERKKDKSKTDDERKKNKSKTDDERKKDKSKTDDEGKYKTPQFRNFQSRRSDFQNRTNFQNTPRWQDPPPPYEGAKNYQQDPKHFNKDEPNVVVKVELSQPGKKQHGSEKANYQGQSHRNDQGFFYNQGQGSAFTYGPPNQYNGPPQGQYYGPPQGQYQTSPPGQYQGPPQGQYQGPPQGQYYGPPPPGQYWGPPQGQYQYQGPNQGAYYGPPQGQYQGPPRGQYQKQYSNQGNRGRGYNKRGGGGPGGNRAGSKHRSSKDKKSGNEQKGSGSDSSSD